MNGERRFWIGFAAVAAILGLFALPGFMERRDRAKQKRTMADMRTLGTALEARATDRNAYLETRDPRMATLTADALDFANAHPLTFAELERALMPTYTRTLPREDAWGNDFEFRVGSFEGGRAASYAIRSLGKDGKADRQQYEHRTISSYEEDLVFSVGNFLQYPEGT